MTVILYTLADCPHSQRLRDQLRARDREYVELDVGKRREILPELLKLTGGKRVVPVLVDGRDIRIAPQGGTTF